VPAPELENDVVLDLYGVACKATFLLLRSVQAKKKKHFCVEPFSDTSHFFLDVM
jgi:hypothetical protein